MPFLSISTSKYCVSHWSERNLMSVWIWKKGKRFRIQIIPERIVFFFINSIRLLTELMQNNKNPKNTHCVVFTLFSISTNIFTNFSYRFYLQEHSNVRSTPLAMLAAQCNKLSNKSPPPLADAAIGKGFHPWKKNTSSPPLGEHSPPLGCNINSSEQQQHRNLASCVTTGSIGNLTARWAIKWNTRTQFFFGVTCHFHSVRSFWVFWDERYSKFWSTDRDPSFSGHKVIRWC